MKFIPTDIPADEVDEIIAKKCGWTEHEIGDGGIYGWLPPDGKHKKSWWGSYYSAKELPKYSSCLDAMHEAEAFLKGDTDYILARAYKHIDSTTWDTYCKTLARLCSPESPVHATAAQKSRAFLIATDELAQLEVEEYALLEI